jgi:hypothetical protein
MKQRKKVCFHTPLLQAIFSVELLNPALCLRETLTSRIERMAIGAGINLDFL